MGCGCLIALAVVHLAAPRDVPHLALHGPDERCLLLVLVGFLGWLFLPWTTLAWAVVYASDKGVTGFGWFLVIFAFVIDITTHLGAAQSRRRRHHGLNPRDFRQPDLLARPFGVRSPRQDCVKALYRRASPGAQ